MTGLDTKFLLPEARPMYNLADERLARGKVTIRFNPHRTYRLKTSLRDTLFHPRIEFRNILFQPLKHLRLALAIVVVRIALHQSQHIRGGMSDLLASSPVTPHPPDIEMGMPAGRNLRAVAVCDKPAPYFPKFPPRPSPPLYRQPYLSLLPITSLSPTHVPIPHH